jgi:hypothetical protein
MAHMVRQLILLDCLSNLSQTGSLLQSLSSSSRPLLSVAHPFPMSASAFPSINDDRRPRAGPIAAAVIAIPATAEEQRTALAAGALSEGDAEGDRPFNAVRLHRHALESVFAFCNLRDLSTMLGVSQEWAAAVHSMRPLQFPFRPKSSDSLPLLCASRLSRHIVALHPHSPLSVEELSLLSRRLTNLRSLHCVLQDEWTLMLLPASLRHLNIQFGKPDILFTDSFMDAEERALDEAIHVMAALPLLESLELDARHSQHCCLIPLTDAPALHSLTLRLSESVWESADVTAALRHMPQLRALKFNPTSTAFTRLLQRPHSMQLDTLDVQSPFTVEFGTALVHLPSLTDLTVYLCSAHTDFLCHLPNLRRLHLFTRTADGPLDAARIVHSLLSLPQRTDLSLDGNGHGSAAFPFRFTSDHLADCLPHMPLLTKLHLFHPAALDSLRFLSSAVPLSHPLTDLSLCDFHPPLPLTELRHVAALSSLTNLALTRVFDRPLDEPTLALYKPPSAVLPALCLFEHAWRPMYKEDKKLGPLKNEAMSKEEKMPLNKKLPPS